MSEQQLSEEQLGKLSEMVTNNLKGLLDNVNKESDGEEKPKGTPTPNNFSMEELADAVASKFETINKQSADKVFDTMWDDKYGDAVSNTPGLDEYLDGEDDYGRVRKDEILKIDDFQERLTALGSISKSYKEATAGAEGRRPHVSTVNKEREEKARTEYQKMEDKLNKGEYNDVSEMAGDFFNSFAKEVEGL